ncbi:ClpC2 [Hibiscus trionum]|uniref:ClpC2 n=1 Tax=Hibiscus trionum TaxID=183268 RepID=A0A9W7M007_HIBTR|nr:ClpC2 [Hibiscus trionum]
MSSRLGRGIRCIAKAKFEGFTKTTLEAIMLAREEFRRLEYDYICKEQLLAGLIGEGTCVAAQVLKSMGITLEGIRKQVEKKSPRVCGFAAIWFLLTCVASDLVRSFEEARKLGHNYIGPEHILLGLLR